MNKIKNFVGLSALLVLAFVLPAKAQVGLSYFAYTGSLYQGSAATNYVVVSRQSKLQQANSIVTYLSATDDQTASKITAYRAANTCYVPVGYTNLTTTNFVSNTNGIAAGTNVVIEHVLTSAAPTYEYGIVGSVTAAAIATNITQNSVGGALVTNFVWQVVLAVAPVTATEQGDCLFPMAPAGVFPVGVGSANIAGACITSGAANTPFLFTLTGGTNATINAVSGFYSQGQ